MCAVYVLCRPDNLQPLQIWVLCGWMFLFVFGKCGCDFEEYWKLKFNFKCVSSVCFFFGTVGECNKLCICGKCNFSRERKSAGMVCNKCIRIQTYSRLPNSLWIKHSKKKKILFSFPVIDSDHKWFLNSWQKTQNIYLFIKTLFKLRFTIWSSDE